jgi:TonB-dependent Receptor Plug Domain
MIAARWLSPFVFAALSACSSQRLALDPRPDPQLITEEEVVASLGATTAYELIHNLRPNFLSYRGETSFDKRTSTPYPNVYVDDQPFGSVSILQSIPASDVSSIRLYRSGEAMTKYGTGNAGGVIAISTRHE